MNALSPILIVSLKLKDWRQCLHYIISLKQNKQIIHSALELNIWSNIGMQSKHTLWCLKKSMSYLFNRYKRAKIVKLIKLVWVIGVEVFVYSILQNSKWVLISSMQLHSKLCKNGIRNIVCRIIPQHIYNPITQIYYASTDFSKASKSIAKIVSRTLFVRHSLNISTSPKLKILRPTESSKHKSSLLLFHILYMYICLSTTVWEHVWKLLTGFKIKCAKPKTVRQKWNELKLNTSV